MTGRYLENVRFLVVDDNAFSSELVRSILRSLGCAAIREARDGATALKSLADFEPDIVILDWVMEPINGLKLTRKIRNSAKAPLSYVPIIMLSAHAEPHRIALARDAGINEFVVKPFSANTLFSRIQAVVERPRQFVRMADYFGPDRRRKMTPVTLQNDRRHHAPTFVPAVEIGRPPAQDH